MFVVTRNVLGLVVEGYSIKEEGEETEDELDELDERDERDELNERDD
tara:strand:- start:24 stop:164 length:141 start_codon:yes stop_codon:yes gene_type:complete